MTEKKPQSTSPFVLFLIVLLGIAAGYFYYVQISSDNTYEVPLSVTLQDENFLKFKDMRFDLSLFSSPVFSSLKTIGNYPVQTGLTGKQDIFSPF